MSKYKKSSTGSGSKHREVYIAAHGPVPVGWYVHHIDHNKKNNDLSNLMAMPERVHTMLHRFLMDRKQNRPFTRKQTEDFLANWQRIYPSLWGEK